MRTFPLIAWVLLPYTALRCAWPVLSRLRASGNATVRFRRTARRRAPACGLGRLGRLPAIAGAAGAAAFGLAPGAAAQSPGQAGDNPDDRAFLPPARTGPGGVPEIRADPPAAREPQAAPSPASSPPPDVTGRDPAAAREPQAAPSSSTPPRPPEGPTPTPPPPRPDPATRPRETAARERRVEVRKGDCLWTLAAEVLGRGASDADIDRYWRTIYAANRDVVGGDPDLIFPRSGPRASGAEQPPVNPDVAADRVHRTDERMYSDRR